VLVPVDGRVDQAGPVGDALQEGADSGVGLLADHGDVLAVLEGGEGVAGARLRRAGRFDDHVERQIHEEQRVPHDGAAARLDGAQGLGAALADGNPFRRQASAAKGAHGGLRVEIREDRHLQPAHRLRLSDHGGGIVPHADHAGAYRAFRRDTVKERCVDHGTAS